MNRQEAIDVCTAMGCAWPYPEWEEGRIELWVAALADEDAETAGQAVVELIRVAERAPSVAEVLEAIAAIDRRADKGGPLELEAPPASKETALAAIAQARAALQRGA